MSESAAPRLDGVDRDAGTAPRAEPEDQQQEPPGDDPPGNFSLEFGLNLRPEDAEIAYQPGKVGPGRKQHVVIKGLGKKRGDADFDLVMSKVMAQVYGPLPEGEAAEQRWKETDVVTIWNEKYTDDKLTRKISYIGTKLGVITEPENFCTPLWNVLPEELPPDLAEMYNPPRITIRDAEHWAEITRHLPNDLGALNRETERRLVAKLKAEIDDTGVKRRLMLEGAFGLWELSTQRFYASRFADETLSALVYGISSAVLDVSWASAAAVWHAVESVELRQRLVRAGVVPALVQLLQTAIRMKRKRRWKRAVAAHSLGALAVLSVDPEARRDVFSHDPGLRCLVDAALMPLDEDLDAPSPPPTPPPEPTEDREGEAEGSRDDDVTVTEQADRRAEGIRGAEAMWTIRMEDPLSRAASAMPGFEDEQQEGLENEASYALKDDLLDIRQQVYSTRWRRKCAVDTLCGLLVRDTEGRVIFSQARGSASLVELHSLQERYVDEIVTHILAALARDNRPRGEGIPLGVVLVAESGQEMVQRLLLKLTADLQADLKRKLHHAVSGPRMGHNPARSCVQPAKAPQQRPPPRQTTPDEGAGDAQPSADSCVEQPHEAPGTPLGPLDVPEDSATEENTDREPSQDSDDAAEDRKLTPGSERGEQDDAEPSSGKSQPGQDEALELLACAVWGTAGAAMRPGMAGFDAQVLALLIKAAYDAVDLQADHGFAMHRVIHCLAGCLYLGAKDPKAAKLLMTMHETGPELDPVAIMQVMAGAALMDGHRSVYKPEGHARIVAAAALASMAVHDNSKPKAMGEKPDMELALSGPYRAALRKAGTISVLLATMKDLPKDSTWQLQLQQVATCCIMYLCTVNSPMDHRELDELVEFSAGPAIWDLPTASYLAAAFWCVVRVPGNLSWLLRDPEERLLRRLVNMINMHRDEIDETIAASIAREALKKQRAEMRAAAERGDLSSWMGGLKGQGSQATLGQRSMRSCATSRSRQVQGWGYASEADSPAMKLPEYAMGTLWIVLYTQLNAVSQVAKANEMYKEDDTSWWGIRMHAETTTAPLTDGQCQSVQAMSELLQITTCNASVVLKTMVVSVLWSLSHLSPRVEDIILDHELGGELMAIVEDLSLSSACQQAAVGFLLLLSNRAETLEQLGGAMKLTQVVVDLTKKAVSATGPKASPGDEADIDLLEFSVRGLARMSNSQAGQRAIVKLQGISALAAAIRADLKAMEHLQRLAPGQDWGAVYPLRRVATLQKLFGPLESMTEEDAKDEGVAEILENTTDIKELEDGDAGMLALWGLLNLSTYEKAQRHIARHAIFSLLKMTYLSPNPTKASVASHILTHIRRNSENVTVFYRAELHLKTKFLVGASGVPDHDRELKKLEPPQLLGHDLPPSLIAGGEDGLETILEVDESEMQAVNDNQRARLQFLQWAGNPDQGPESLITLAKTDRGEDSIPRYLVDAEERARARAKSSGHRSRRDQRSMTEYQDKLEDALADFGSIRSYRGEYLRATLFQSLQAHCSSMWRYAANLNEKMTATEEQEEDETVNDDFLHPDDQAFLSDLRRSEQHHGGKQSVRELRSASAKQPARRPGSAMPPGSKTQLPARPAAEQKKSLAARPSPRNARPKSGAGGALPPTPLRNRKTPSASGVPHAPVAQPPKTPHLLSGGQGPYRHGLKSTSAASTGKTASNHRRPSTAPSRGATESVAGMTPRPPPLSVVKEMAKVCPSLMTLEHKPSPSPPSVAGPRPSSAAIAPRSLSSRPVSSQVRSLQESRQGHSADSVRGRSSSPAGSNWTPKVEFYAQDSVPPFNPPDVSRRLLTADCPEEVEKKLVTASSRLAKDPSLLKDLLRPPSPSRSPTTGPATPALPRIKGASTGGGVGESLTAMVSAEDVASDLNSYAEDQASALAREKIGWDIHLQRPQTGYSNPHTGVIRPLGERISSLWDPEIPLSLQRSEAEMGRIPKDLPRPVTMLTGSGDDASKAKSPAATKAQLMARGIKEEHADKYIQEQEGKQQEGSKYLKVAVGVHEKEPHAVYAFKETGVSGSTAPIIVFEHVDGCKFCEELFGHFLLPNGKLAHYYHQNPHDRRGRFVSMSAPPSPAYTLKDLLQAAFLLPPEFIKDLRHPGRPVMEFAKLTAFPLPPLAPVPVRSTLTVRPSRRDDERFPRGWRLSQGAGMGFTATPERVDRMDTLVIKLADDIVDQFDLKSSVFAERETECDARSFFDSPAVVKEQAEKDVSQLDRCPPFKLWLEKCVVGGYKLQWPAIRQAVVEAYDGIMQAFNYYGCQGTGSPFALSLKEYRAFLGDLGIVDEENPCLCRARCLSHFKETVTNCRIPIYLPKTPVKKKRKKKTKADESAADEKARSPSPTRRPASARLRAADDEEPEINRPEFAQVIVRLAVHMFGAPARTDGGAQPSVASAAEPPKELPPGDGSAAPKDGDIPRKPKAQLLKALEWDPQLDIAKAVRRFAREVLEARLPATALNNSNEFRFKRLYTKEMDDTLKGEFSLPSDDVLKLLFRRQSVKRQLGTAEVHLMQMSTWLELLDIVGLIGPSPMGLQISLADARSCFVKAKMRVANDTLDLLRHESMTFCEFREALARVADCISWPDQETMDAKGFSNLYDYLKADLKTRPRLTRRPSYGISTPKTRPLHLKLKELLQLMFQVFAQMSMYSPSRLIKVLAKEVKKKKIRKRKHTLDYTPGTSCRGNLQFSNPPAKAKKKPPPPAPE